MSDEQPDPILAALDELDMEPMDTPPALMKAIEELEAAPALTPRPTSGHPLAGDLKAAAESANEEKFMTLVEQVLHEPDAVAVPLLAPYLDAAPAIGRLAAHGLLMLGPASLATLLEALQDGPPAARQPAAWALGSLRDPRSTAALTAVLSQPDAPNSLVDACLNSLAELADRAAVPALLAVLRDPDRANFRPQVCRALGFIGDPQAVNKIAPLLANPKPLVRLRAAEALIRLLDKRGWAVLFSLLRGDDPRTGDTVAALRGLGELSSALAPFLGDDDYHTRRDAAEVLGSFGDTRAVPPLIEAMGDINPWVRGAATYALGRLEDRRAFKWLIMALKDESSWVRQSAIRGLGLLGDRRAQKPLEELLFDADVEVATAAQEALNALTER